MLTHIFKKNLIFAGERKRVFLNECYFELILKYFLNFHKAFSIFVKQRGKWKQTDFLLNKKINIWWLFPLMEAFNSQYWGNVKGKRLNYRDNVLLTTYAKNKKGLKPPHTPSEAEQSTDGHVVVQCLFSHTHTFLSSWDTSWDAEKRLM